MRSTVLICAIVGLASVLAGVARQSPMASASLHIPPSASKPVDCRTERCEIALEHLVTLSDSADPGLFGERLFVQQDGAGRWITSTISFDQLAVFSASGEFEQVVGRRGQGPMEFRMVVPPLLAPGDSLYAIDFYNARLTVLNANLEYVRDIQFPYPTVHPSFVRPDGSIIVAGQIQSREAIGYPVHMFDRDGQRVRSFGMDVPQYRADMRRLLTRTVGMAVDGTVWTAPPGRYLIERWDPDTGRMLERIPRNAPSWFTESGAPAGSPREVKPNTVITSVWGDDQGFVWLFMDVPAEDWRPLYNRGQAPPHQQFKPGERNEFFDWLVEVIDPASGALIASKRFPTEVWTRPPGHYFVSRAGTRGDAVQFHISRPTLIRTEEP